MVTADPIATSSIKVLISGIRWDQWLQPTGVCILHTAPTERVLKLRAHKSITLSRVGKNEEVDLEDEGIEQDWDYDEAQSPCQKVADPESGRNT